MADCTVFGTRISPFVEKVVRALQMKGVDYELVEPKGPGDFKKWNPQTAKMPVMDLKGERIYDSTFILRRLDELYPEPPLLSSDPVAAASQRQLEDWADESLYWYTMGLRWSPEHEDATVNQILPSTIPAMVRPLVSLFLKRQLKGMTKAQGMGRLPNEVLVKEIGDRLDDLVRMLGDRDFFYGDRPSVADLAVYGQLNGGASDVTPEIRALIQERPKLVEYMKRVEQSTGG